MSKKTFPASAVRFITIDENQTGQRLDNFLLKTLKKLPRSRLYRIIRKGEVRVNKKRVKPEYKLCAGDSLRIPPIRLDNENPGQAEISTTLKQKLELAILFENEHVIILDKPSGLAVHSGSGLRFGVIDILRASRPHQTLELVHRLDRDTSGCLMLSKNRKALLVMQRLLQGNEIRKSYLAMVKGHWNKSVDSIELPLKRQVMPNGETKVFVDERGQSAKTIIDQVTHFNHNGIKYSLIKLHLLTGRTHQIRVHCQSQGHEIAGDSKYFDRSFNQAMKALGVKRLLLHAFELEIPKNAHTKALKILAPEPVEFRMLSSDEQEI